MKSDLDNKLVAVVRVRGRIGVRRGINETLNRLGLKRVNSVALLFGNAPNLGMIRKCNDFVTYGEINLKVLEKVASKSGTKLGKDDAEALLSGKKKISESIKLPIRLKPPRHGYESTKLGYSNGGALGYRGDGINELLGRMS
jgi:large subunit ribosomal protein L30